MIYFASTLKEYKDVIDSYIKLLGENTRIGVMVADTSVKDNIRYFLDDLTQLEYVFINKEYGNIVGDEADEYKPKDGEVPAVLIS